VRDGVLTDSLEVLFPRSLKREQNLWQRGMFEELNAVLRVEPPLRDRLPNVEDLVSLVGTPGGVHG